MNPPQIPPNRRPYSLSRREIVYLLLPAVVITLALMTFAVLRFGINRSEYSPEAHVDLRGADTNAHVRELNGHNSAPVLRVAVAPVISPEKSLELYSDFVSYLSQELGREPVFLRGRSYSRVNDLVRLRQCDLALVCTYSFVLGEQEFGMELLAIPQIGGETVYRSFIIVPEPSEVTSLMDLRGKRFASSDVLSTSGWLFPMAWLRSQGVDAARFFGKHIITGSHDQSVYAVSSGITDGAAVDSLVYQQVLSEDPSLHGKLKVIQRSSPFGMPPLVVPAQLSPELKGELQRVLLSMHERAPGKSILSSLNIERFVLARKTSYDSVRQLRAIWEESP